MSTVEAPFIIAVIREKEKSFLGTNEMTRIMHADSAQSAREVLMSTPYAVFLSGDTPLRTGLTAALEAEFMWLTESLDNKEALAFIGARYDALHVAQGIIALQKGEVHMPATSHIGILSHDMLHNMIFTPEYIPSKHTHHWYEYIQEQKHAIQENTWTMPLLFEAMQRALEERLAQIAFTPFMKELAEHVKNHHASDTIMQKNSDVAHATQYEWEWDAKAIALAQKQRFEPIGYDPIIAYWIMKEMEIKTITLMFASIMGGFSKEETTSLIRSSARA